MTWASTRLGVKCQIGRMARSLLSARKTASTSVSWMYWLQSLAGSLPSKLVRNR